MALIKLISFLGLLSASVVAQDPSLLDSSKYCDAACKQRAIDAASWERSQHVSEPLDAFYNTPAKFGPDTKPGEVLRVEEHTNLTGYTVPSGLTMSRILYTSQDLNGTTVLASAFALWPYEGFDYTGKGTAGNGSDTKFPLVAWAHGTTGLFQRCASSNYKALQYHFITTFNLAFEGFAIIDTDYAGLGASATAKGGPFSHQYGAAPAAANDLAYSVVAIRKAFPNRFEPEGPFVAMGHSQGGATAWAYAERQAQQPLPGYRGTVTFSPPLGSVEQVRQGLAQLTAGVPISGEALGFVAPLNAAITAVYPSFNYSGLSDLVYDRWNKVLAPLQSCLPSINLLFGDISAQEYIHTAWINSTTVKEYEKRMEIARKKFAGPMSVVLGSLDRTPVPTLNAAIDDTCAMEENKDQHLEYHQFGAMGHFGVISASRARWLQWVKDRVTDKPLAKKCGSKTLIPGIDTNHSSFVGAFPPNWLVEGVPKDEEWKLTL